MAELLEAQALAGRALLELAAGDVALAAVFVVVVDVDAVVVTVCDLLKGGQTSTGVASAAVLLALGANAVLKTGISFYAGTRAFGWRVLLAFAVMFAAGTGVYFMVY